jgi:serine O-acetyltransferase
MFENLREDLARKASFYNVSAADSWHGGSPFWSRLRVLLELGSVAVMVYRFGAWAARIRSPFIRKPLLALYFLLNCCVMLASGISIQLDSKIGKGFVIHNFSCIFILAERIGNNVTVNQGVTIGRLRGRPRLPIIGNNVYFGSGAKALGDVTVGDNVVVGANSVVLMSVPSDCTVLGIPARIISRNVRSEYLKLVAQEQAEKTA